MSQKGNGTQKYTDYTKEEIGAYLIEFKQLIRNGSYTIALNKNRRENVDFMEDYDINTEKAKQILLSIDVLDFCYAADNTKPEFAHEKLYVFCKEVELYNRGTPEDVDIYIKSNLAKTRRGNSILFVVSFHKRNNSITYCFKR